jgi:hypothetical protein
MRTCSIASAVFLVVAGALALSATLTREWYRIRVDFVAGSGMRNTVLRYGLLGYGLRGHCLAHDRPQHCFEEDDLIYRSCSRSADDLVRETNTRVHAVLGLMISSAILALIGTISSALAFRQNLSHWFGRISLLCSGLTASTGVAGAILFYVSIEHWYFCDKSFCDLWADFGIPTADCANSLSGSFYAGIAGVVCAVLAFVCQLIAIVRATDNGIAIANDIAPTEPQLREVTRDDHLNLQVAGGRVRPPPPPAPAPPPPPAGDWVYDAGSGLYWSDQQHVYLDVVTSKCYDPKSGQWHDPVGGVVVSE